MECLEGGRGIDNDYVQSQLHLFQTLHPSASKRDHRSSCLEALGVITPSASAGQHRSSCLEGWGGVVGFDNNLFIYSLIYVIF